MRLSRKPQPPRAPIADLILLPLVEPDLRTEHGRLVIERHPSTPRRRLIFPARGYQPKLAPPPSLPPH